MAYVRRERLEYSEKRDRARLYLEQCYSIKNDKADQYSFGIPRFISSTKDEGGNALKAKRIGILGHHHNKTLHLFTMKEKHEAGTSNIVKDLHKFIIDKDATSALPPKIYIQLDNFLRENKMKYLFTNMEYLVSWRVFAKVEVSFLPLGHTHEDIAHASSKTSRHLCHNCAVSLANLHQQLCKTYGKHVLAGHMSAVANSSKLHQTEMLIQNLFLLAIFNNSNLAL